MKYFIADVESFSKDLTELLKKYPSLENIIETFFNDLENGNLAGEDIQGLKLKDIKFLKQDSPTLMQRKANLEVLE